MTDMPLQRQQNDLEDSAAAGPVTHDEARAILTRFANSHFKNPGERARISIPADPKRDDDLRMAAYIVQCRQLQARAEAAERERDQWREDAKVLKDEVEVRRNAPFGIKGGACFPYCPERAARLCDCPQCQWADRIHAACLDTNRSDAIMRAGGGVSTA